MKRQERKLQYIKALLNHKRVENKIGTKNKSNEYSSKYEAR